MDEAKLPRRASTELRARRLPLARVGASTLALLCLLVATPGLSQSGPPQPTSPDASPTEAAESSPEPADPDVVDASPPSPGRTASFDEPLEELEPRPVLTLEQARAQLYENHTAVAIGEQSVLQAETMEMQAFAIWYPSVNLTAVYTLNDEEISLSQPNAYAPLGPYLDAVYDSNPDLRQQLADPRVIDARELAAMPPADLVVQNRHDFRVVGTVTQTLFNYRAFPLLELAQTQVAFAEANKEVVVQQLERALVQAYFNAVMFRRLIRVSQRNVELARINYESAHAALEEGVGMRFEVNRAEVELSSAEREVQNARLAYELALDALGSLLELDEEFDVESPPELDVPDDVEPLLEQAREERAEVRRDELATELEEGWVDEVDSRFWPVVRAQAQGVVQRASAFGGDNFRWTLTLTASWDIFDGGFRAVERTQKEVAAVQRRLQEQRTRMDIEAEVRQAWLEVRTEQRRVASARAEVDLAVENVELTEDAREFDAATRVDLEIAQRQRYLAELALATAEIQLQAKIYVLYHLVGS